jgi:hypothetical protein
MWVKKGHGQIERAAAAGGDVDAGGRANAPRHK